MSSLPESDEFARLYVENGMTQTEIAEELGCSQTTVSNRLSEAGVETRNGWNHRIKRWLSDPDVPFYTKQGGYERVEVKYEGQTDMAYVHRLVAVAEHGYEAVKGMHVHHKNGVKWDNRPSNLEVLDPSEHTSQHTKKLWEDGVLE